MKINLWYSKSMEQWRWTLSEEFKNGVTKLEQHSGQRIYLRDAMEDVAKTVEYMLESKDKGCLLYTSPSPRDLSTSRMPSSA